MRSRCLDPDVPEELVIVPTQLRLVLGLECDVEWRGKRDRVSVDGRHLHQLAQRAVLPGEPAPGAATGRIVCLSPHDVRIVGRHHVDEDDVVDLHPRVTLEDEGVGPLDGVLYQIGMIEVLT
jgi:hypothetical protein